MNQKEFEQKILDLIKEYAGNDLKFLYPQSIILQIRKGSVPLITINGMLLSKEIKK